MRHVSILLVLALLSPGASAQEVDLHGFVDYRLVSAPNETSWIDGGLGKSRFGGGGVLPRFGAAAVDGSVQVTPDILAFADLQFHTTDRPSLDLTEAYLRYRPVSLTPLRWAVKVGAFLPPLSLENDGIGWTSPWTLTPSAINTWVGEELRIIGGEGRVEWRGAGETFEAAVGLFGDNDPAGAVIAARGWALGDMVTGLGNSMRMPDVTALAGGDVPPVRENLFANISRQIGWYGAVQWRSVEYGRIAAIRYDNRANPSSSVRYGVDDATFAWNTRFWGLGGQTEFDDVVLIAQAMAGATEIAPTPRFHITTDFQAAYLLAAWDAGEWCPAARLDVFGTQQGPATLRFPLSEHGSAVTLALNWRPLDWLRVTGEVLRIDSWRRQRLQGGSAPGTIDTQSQLAVRLLY